MNKYIKPNVFLPISLHDARVTKVISKYSTENFDECSIVLEFENGFIKIDKNEVYQTGKSSLEISGIDYDYSHVYYCEGNRRKRVEFEKFAEDVLQNSFEIIDETYGYNQTKFSGNLIFNDKWLDAEIEIYHFNQSIYSWENS